MQQNNTPLVRIVDDDEGIRNSMAFLLEGEGWEVKTYRDGSQFLASNDFARPGCRCLHNQVYWNLGQYVGFGPGAESSIGWSRAVSMRETSRSSSKWRLGVSSVT